MIGFWTMFGIQFGVVVQMEEHLDSPRRKPGVTEQPEASDTTDRYRQQDGERVNVSDFSEK